ncbi:unnamed protein product, partial [Nesidiocoris tenuis]
LNIESLAGGPEVMKGPRYGPICIVTVGQFALTFDATQPMPISIVNVSAFQNGKPYDCLKDPNPLVISERGMDICGLQIGNHLGVSRPLLPDIYVTPTSQKCLSVSPPQGYCNELIRMLEV